jgi:ketosteroid isomerase-like protein
MDLEDREQRQTLLAGSASRRAVLRRLGGGGLVAGGGLLLSRAPVRAQPDDIEANKVLARRFHDDLFEQGNLAAADEILAPDFVWRSPPQTEFLIGPEAVKQQATDFRAFIPDVALTDDDEIAEGDRVVIRWTATGTAQTESGGVPVVYTGIDIFRIADGKLAELWQNTDDLGLEQQLAAGAAAGTPVS